MTNDELLDALVDILSEIKATLPNQKDEWDESRLVRLAVERMWITAGNTSEAYRRSVGLSAGDEPIDDDTVAEPLRDPGRLDGGQRRHPRLPARPPATSVYPAPARTATVTSPPWR